MGIDGIVTMVMLVYVVIIFSRRSAKNKKHNPDRKFR